MIVIANAIAGIATRIRLPRSEPVLRRGGGGGGGAGGRRLAI